MATGKTSRAIAASLLAIVMLAGLSPWTAHPLAAQTERLLPDLTEEEEEVVVFVLGNTLFTIFHEIGHALVHHYELPVLGREEDAVDSFAAILMISEEADPFLDAMIIAAADGWFLSSEDGRFDDISYWGEHSLDEQRFYAIACLVAGSDPEGFYDYARDVGLPEERIDRCPADYGQAIRGWNTLLKPYLRSEGATGPGRVVVTWGAAEGEHRRVRDLVRGSTLAKVAADAIQEMLALPGDVPLAFASCGFANAFFDTETGGVTMCYELILEFERLILDDLARN